MFKLRLIKNQGKPNYTKFTYGRGLITLRKHGYKVIKEGTQNIGFVCYTVTSGSIDQLRQDAEVMNALGKIGKVEPYEPEIHFS